MRVDIPEFKTKSELHAYLRGNVDKLIKQTAIEPPIFKENTLLLRLQLFSKNFDDLWIRYTSALPVMSAIPVTLD